MAIIFDTVALPEKGQVNLTINRSFEIKVTAEEARRQVNRWLLNEVSYMFGAAPPPCLLVSKWSGVFRLITVPPILAGLV